MKISFLMIGTLLFSLGVFTQIKFFLAAGIIFVILSFFGQTSQEKKKEKIQQRKMISPKKKCRSCGTEILPDDSYCPECGKKILP